MSEDNEVCETPTLTSESRNPFKTDQVTPSCYQKNIIKKIKKVKQEKNPSASKCCPMEVPNSILSSCIDTCGILDSNLQKSCRDIIEGVKKLDFNATITLESQIKNKLSSIGSKTPQQKEEIYNAVIGQLMCDTAFRKLHPDETNDKQKCNAIPLSDLNLDKIQQCVAKYEKDLNETELKTCIDGTEDGSSTTKSSDKFLAYENLESSLTTGLLNFLTILLIMGVILLNIPNTTVRAQNRVFIFIVGCIVTILYKLYNLYINYKEIENFDSTQQAEKKKFQWANMGTIIIIGVVFSLLIIVNQFGVGLKHLNNFFIVVCSILMMFFIPKTLVIVSLINIMALYGFPDHHILLSNGIKQGWLLLGVVILSMGGYIYSKWQEILGINTHFSSIDIQKLMLSDTTMIVYIIITLYILSFLILSLSNFSPIKFIRRYGRIIGGILVVAALGGPAILFWIQQQSNNWPIFKSNKNCLSDPSNCKNLNCYGLINLIVALSGIVLLLVGLLVLLILGLASNHLKPTQPIDLNLSDSANSETIRDFITTKYIYILLPFLEYLNSTSSSGSQSGLWSKLLGLFRRNPFSQSASNRDRLKGISNMFKTELYHSVSKQQKNLMQAKKP